LAEKYAMALTVMKILNKLQKIHTQNPDVINKDRLVKKYWQTS